MPPSPEHIQKPHLRRLHAMQSQQDGSPVVALRDPLMLRPQTIIVPTPVMTALQQCDGEHSLEQISWSIKQDSSVILQLIEKLDEFGLIWGPTFEEMEKTKKRELDDRGAYPPRITEQLAQEEDNGRSLLKSWLEQGDDPEIDFTPSALFAPHLIQYSNSWPIYAGCWHTLQNVDPPDRVIVISTNHYGIGDGVVCTKLGFETPLGRCEPDSNLLNSLLEHVGDCVLTDEIDHIANTGIEVQLPWIQHCWGNIPILAVLVPDPAQSLLEDNNDRIGREEFNGHLRACIESAPGRSFIVGSGDLSNVGPHYGEPRPVDKQRSLDVEHQDRELLGHIVNGDLEAFMSAMDWNRNPTGWTGAGVVASMLELLEPEMVELIDYKQRINEKQTLLVSCCGLLMK